MSKRIAYGSNLIGVDSGGGSSYTAGDGIDITNNSISVDTEFTEAQTRANIASGETVATILGKIKKWFTDLPNMFVSKSGGTFNGDVTVDSGDSSSTSSQESQLIAGNNISEGTAGSAWGSLRIFGKGAFRARLMARNITNHRDFEFPDKSGTIFLQEGGTITGGVAIDRANGTTEAIGYSTLTLGNNTASGTEGNSTGRIGIYSNGTKYAYLQASNMTGNRTIELPDANGTLALTSDIIPAENVELSDETSVEDAIDSINGQLNGVTLLPITQSAYDQLITKDPNTLYIISSDN